MAGFRVAFLGLKRFTSDLRRAQREIPRELDRSLRRASLAIERHAQEHGFQGERTRALYAITGGRRRRRRPARPITSPPKVLGVFEGTYRQAISHDLRGSRRRRRAEVGPVKLRYPRAHEFGLGHMPKRPVMGPAVDATERDVFRILGTTFKVIG